MTTSISAHHQVRANSTADQVWRAMRRFEDLSWATDIDDLVVEGNGVGMVRKVRFGGSQDWTLERLTARNDEQKTFSFAVDEGGMPGYRNYRAEVRAEPDGENCIIHWSYFADVDEGVEEKQGLLDLLAEGISTLFAAQFQDTEID
jgi:polyketide cyclase/dehydrase/lipid transport protein